MSSGHDLSAAEYARAQELFVAIFELAPAQRAAYLDAHAPDAPAVRREVESLLAQHDDDSTFLEGVAARPTNDAGSDASWDIEPGDRIGQYTVVRIIGEGGFGLVCEAEQTEPVHRRAAVKVLKAGMDTGQVIARFEAERQALARMEHPLIAKVLDAGATESGRPYFAMEYVDGIPITEYCDGCRLTTDARLRLFIQVCEAIQHAHQKGIVHRDIKPSNVLVCGQDGKPAAKVIDFGIAKATDPRGDDNTRFTALGQLVGTPPYMSPEQALGSLDVDTRSDIYSLGALLYELLVGTPPLDPETLRGANFLDVQRLIREQRPDRPSTRIARADPGARAAARARTSNVRALQRELRGDLDWIVLRALEKDRARRYATAAGLAADVRRHLQHEPVVARPPSRVDWLVKFARRHRAAVAAGVLVALVLSVAVIALGHQRRVFRQQADVTTSMLSWLGEVFMAQSAGKSPTGLDPAVLDAVAGEIEDGGAFSNQPKLRSRLHGLMAFLYRTTGNLDQAANHWTRALELRRAELGEHHPDTLLTMNNLVTVFLGKNDIQQAVAMARRAHAAASSAPDIGPEHRISQRALRLLGTALLRYDRLDEAASVLRRAVEIAERTHGAGYLGAAGLRQRLGECLTRQGDFAAAESELLNALECIVAARGVDHDDAESVRKSLVKLYEAWGRPDAARRWRPIQ